MQCLLLFTCQLCDASLKYVTVFLCKQRIKVNFQQQIILVWNNYRENSEGITVKQVWCICNSHYCTWPMLSAFTQLFFVLTYNMWDTHLYYQSWYTYMWIAVLWDRQTEFAGGHKTQCWMFTEEKLDNRLEQFLHTSLI